MIISHKHQFIFIKPYKTAGTSVELVLASHCGDQDVITPFIFEPDPDIRQKVGAREPANFEQKVPLHKWRPGDLKRLVKNGEKPIIRFSEHQTASGIRNLIGEEVWKKYRKVSIIRNPWDHAVSFYNWVTYRKQFTGTFEEYVHSKYPSYWPFLAIDDEYCIDIVIRFEYLTEDLSSGLSALGLPAEVNMPRAKTSIRKDRDYRDYYTDETKEVVRDRNSAVIDRFGYTFD